MRKNIFITDGRVKLMQEVLQGIRSIKMYAWEECEYPPLDLNEAILT